MVCECVAAEVVMSLFVVLQMRKIRSLTELVTEAEDVISNPNQNKKVRTESLDLPF